MRRLGRADVVLKELEYLVSPMVVSRCDRGLAEHIASLAWQRELMWQASVLFSLLRSDCGIDRADIRARLDALRNLFDEGPPT